MSASAPTRVEVETELGSFTLAVDEANAPISAGNFLAYVDGGHLDGSAVYRIVTMHNQPPETPHKIEVIQWGWRLTDGTEPPFPPIPHEPTSQTGLRHLDGTLSMTRRAGHCGAGFLHLPRRPARTRRGRRPQSRSRRLCGVRPACLRPPDH
ncbi:peptidylprolyl isomerase [Nitratireductor sp. StC3]|uniref:peptidylprolyl isomerase n=1 Tax=Nitratireductor sp. StC3 TaxID=2126741 RepID=UPI001FDFBFA6|nr:peptidylprolyl isomerase [Nitratireductor sp. StC3]